MSDIRLRRWRIGAALFLATGIAILAAAALLHREGYETASAVALNVGAAILAIVLVDILWRTSGGNPLDEQFMALAEKLHHLSKSVAAVERARLVGLNDAFARQGDVGTQTTWEELIRRSRRRCDVMARTSAGWMKSRHLAQLIVDRITHDNVHFRWLIMSRTNPYLNLLIQHDPNVGSMLDEKIGKMEALLRSIRNLVPDDKIELFEVRRFEHAPLYCSIVRTDETWYITHYLFSRPSDDCPLIAVHGEDTEWGARYQEEFEEIWKDAEDLFGRPNVSP
jgi:hypothetical protein